MLYRTDRDVHRLAPARRPAWRVRRWPPLRESPDLNRSCTPVEPARDPPHGDPNRYEASMKGVNQPKQTNRKRPCRLVSLRRTWFLLDLLGPCVGRISPHNPKVAGSNPAPATMKNEGLADASAASRFRLPRLHPGIGSQWAPAQALQRVFTARPTTVSIVISEGSTSVALTTSALGG